MNEAYWALAAGCVPDALPWDIPRIAHAADFQSCGMWIDPKTTWDTQALSKTRAALDDTGVKLVDVEALWLAGGSVPNDTHKLTVEAGLELGAKNVLVVSVHEDYDHSVQQFRALCDMASGNIRINLEFGEFTKIRSLSAARKFVAAVDHPAAGILIDLMHINRAGEALPDLEDDVFSYVQACDYWRTSAELAGDAYIEAAVDFRGALGEGEANPGDIQTVCRSTKDVSLEIRSKMFRDTYPDPIERAKQIHARCVRADHV